MNDTELVERIVSGIRPNAKSTLRVTVVYDIREFRLPWIIRIQSDKPCWPMSVFKSQAFVGKCRTKETAMKRANRIIRILQKLSVNLEEGGVKL